MARLFPILLALVLSLALPVRADVVPGLYAASVAVSDQGEAALAAGAREALSEVIVKVSGSPAALDDPTVREALAGARKQVQKFSFRRDDNADTGLSARFEFDSGYVSRLLAAAGLPLWTANRPRVLVWAAVESAGERRFVNPADTPELAAELLDAFQRRGVPAQFPLFDLGDATALGLEDIWAQDMDAVLAASARYALADVLVGRAVEVSNGKWLGDWNYLSGLERRDRSLDAPTPPDFFAGGVGLVAEDMAARYAVAPTGENDGQVRLVVLGVQDFADYAAIRNWLQGLELISDASVASIDGERTEFTLTALADADRLAQIIELNRRLQPLDPTGQRLEYQWLK
ncbi:DUF2066 domain-containing protein [Mangrovimicrobium sediminis]|uniref:DUF2066 domain-containing protein n=1 Tax=Mangrovimicrobium sediminis TaxID=2562682 RepID=UPI00143673B5|nr:DUF2066 domain-containing protein [Haliea sp. SAOS-164]